MARRTKEAAEQTRSEIIDAARRVFSRRGVSQTTLEHIAREAGVTRGAIYWHFANKTELFFAMRDQVQIPLLDRMYNALLSAEGDPLAGLEQFMLQVIEGVSQDKQMRETYDIIAFKCEYVNDLEGVLGEMLKTCRDMVNRLEKTYQRAEAANQLREGVDPRLAALESYAFLSGLCRLWLSDHRGQIVRKQTREMIAGHIATRRRS